MEHIAALSALYVVSFVFLFYGLVKTGTEWVLACQTALIVSVPFTALWLGLV